MQRVDYYELLGVAPTATSAQIKAAYRSLAKVMHPDAGGTAGAFRLLSEAYATLTDAERRAAYDRSLRQPTVTATTTPAPTRHPRPGRAWRTRTSRPVDEDADFTPTVPDLAPDTIPWWPAVKADQSARFLPVDTPGHAPVVTVLGGWPLILITTLPLRPSPLLLSLWLVLLAAACTSAFWLVRLYQDAARSQRAFHREFGTPRVVGAPSAEHSELGEHLTAELLSRYLTRLPGVRIFHGLSWPDSVFADIDHAVLCGRRLVLIESKVWLPGHYAADEDGRLWRNDHPFRGGDSRLPEGVTAYRELLPDVEVRGALILYPSAPGEITTEEPDEELAPPMTPEQFVHEIGGWLAADPSTVDRDAFRTLVGRVISTESK